MATKGGGVSVMTLLGESPTRAIGWERYTWRVAAGLTGITVGISVSTGDLLALAWAAALALAVFTFARAQGVPGGTRLVVVLATALAAHMALAMIINAFATGFGGGFVTGDDAAYFRLASRVAQFVHGQPMAADTGPPKWGGDFYLLGAFTYLEAGLFIVFGPDVRLPLLLNGALAVCSAILCYRAAAYLFEPRAAMIAASVVAFYPSLMLWSSLNLKDSLTTFLAMTAIWTAIEFTYKPSFARMLLPLVSAEVVVSLRAYVTVVIAIAALVTVPLVRATLLRRVGLTAAVFVLAAGLAAQGMSALGLGPGAQIVTIIEQERQAMAVGARTAFVPTTAPTQSPASSAAAATTAQPTPTDAQATQAESDSSSTPVRALSYLPIGLAYALLFPVPFLAARPQELIAAPEMIVWYVLALSAGVTLIDQRRRWRALAMLALVAGGLLLVFALVEGNVGTLFRHRGMVVPMIAILASPSLSRLIERMRTR